jgi:signal transduction histidine kinase
MEVKYETEKKEVQITTLKKEKALYIGLGIVGTALFLALSLLFIIRHRFDINKRKLAEQQTALAEQQTALAEQQIKHLEQEQQMIATQSVIDGEIAERTRLARDLHDGLGGMLSILKLHLDDVADAREMLDQSINELHRVAHHLMPQSLLRDGLKTALDDFCKAIPNAQFHYFGDNHRLDDKFELLIYRCAYELLNNAFKYANASNINIQLVKNTDYVSLTVEDNGCGFDPEKITSGMGLESLRARVAVYNGKIDIFSAPGKGTEVFVELKIEN